MRLNLLSGPRQKFAEGIVAGLCNTDAYLAAYPATSSDSARGNAGRLITNEDIQQEITRLRKLAEEAADGAVMTLSATLVFLSDVIRTPVGQLGPDDPLTQDWMEEHTAFGVKKRIRGFDKLRAIETLSRLTGRFIDTVRVDSDKVVRIVIGD